MFQEACEERHLIDIQPESDDSETMVEVCTYKCTEVGSKIGCLKTRETHRGHWSMSFTVELVWYDNFMA